MSVPFYIRHYFCDCTAHSYAYNGDFIYYTVRVRKPTNKETALLIGIVAVAVVYILIYFRWEKLQLGLAQYEGFLKRMTVLV